MDKKLYLYCKRVLREKLIKFKNNKVILYPREWFSELDEELQIKIICVCLKSLNNNTNNKIQKINTGYMDSNAYMNFG